MASALDLVPDSVKPFTPATRDDLRVIAVAEDIGYTVSFRNDHWHNSAQFKIGRTTIWWTHRGWKAATIIGEGDEARYEKGGRIYPDSFEGLGSALVVEKLRAERG